MAAEQSSVPDSIQSAGETVHRPICDKGEQPATSLLHVGSGPHGLRSRCHDHQLEQDAGLCVSSHRSDTQGPGETLKIQELQDASNSPAVAQANVVPKVAVSSGSRTNQPAFDGGLVLHPDMAPIPQTTTQALHLTAWSISSDPTLQTDFRKRLPTWLQRQGDLQPELLIIPASPSTSAGAGVAKSTRIRPLWEL